MNPMTKRKIKKQPMVEICASFSFKVNPNNHLNIQEKKVLVENYAGYDYENSDFFLSAKTTCKASEMTAKVDILQGWCKDTVIHAANAYLAELHIIARGFMELRSPQLGKEN